MRITWTSAKKQPGDGDRQLSKRLELDGGAQPSCVFAFVAAEQDLDQLGTELAALKVPVVGCTTAGQIGSCGFEVGDVTAAAVFDDLQVRSFLIRSLTELDASLTVTVAEVRASGVLDSTDVSVFGLVLVDGLASAEERLMVSLYDALPGLPLAGGSAADNLTFTETRVYHDGRFLRDAGVLHVFTTRRKVAPLKLQHHVPTEQRMVITSATPSKRTVHEINGQRAVDAYAEAIGVPVDELTDAVIASRPLILRVGDDHYIRSVRAIREDGSLELFCAIEQGLVLRLGRNVGILEALETAFARAAAAVGEPVLVIGMDCILRRLEIARASLTGEVGQFLSSKHVIGFSTYGEQFNYMHANQTFTGFMVGGL
ncbi:MAG: FIST N-terminal domain-containing protein [Kofleriaceae bacterium]